MENYMLTTLEVAGIGVGVLLLSTIAAARPCIVPMDVVLKGTITKTEPWHGGESYKGVYTDSGIYLYVADPSLDCSPIQVNTNDDNKCKVGDSVGTLTGHLARSSDGSWMLMEKNSSYLPVANNLFDCSK